MNKFLLFLTIIANSGCNNQNLDSSENSNISVIHIEPSDNPAIYGEWSICTFNSNGHVIQLYICPILIFKKDGTGAELSGSNHSSFFKWTLQKNVLIISAKADNRGFFMNGTLVSFKGGIDTSEFQDMKMNDSLPMLNDTVCYSKLVEVRTITYNQVDKLTDILYNYGFGGPVYIGSSSMCYFPRNAILFLDANGKVYEFIEICFECRETRTSSERISLGQMCNQKMQMLKNFFKDAQIEYGITKGLRTDN